MARTQTVAHPPLVESGLTGEELALAIATRYMEAMHAKFAHQPTTVSEHHLKYGHAIVARNFYYLEFITNGLNETGKKIFIEVTGYKLPKANGAARKALMEWAGTDAKQDELSEARRLLTVWHDSAARQINNMSAFVEMIENGYAQGLVQLLLIDRKNMLANREGTAMVNLSKKGFLFSITGPYIKAYLKVQALRVEVGEIKEPVWVVPAQEAPVAAAVEPAPAPATAPLQASTPEQIGFGF